MLLLMLDNQESVSISDTSVKQVHQSMIGKRFIPPAAEKVWPKKASILGKIASIGKIFGKTPTTQI